MKISVSLFCKNLLLNLLIAAQVCASAVFGMISVAVIAKAYLYYDLTKPIEDAYAYIPQSGEVYFTDSAVVRYLESGEIRLSRTQSENWVWQYDPSIADPKEAHDSANYRIDGVYAFGSLVSDVMKTQLTRGRWFSEERTDGVIECVIVGDTRRFSVGSLIDGAEFDVTANKDENGVEIIYEIKKEYKFKVVGSCPSGTEVLEFGVGTMPAYALEVSDLFKTVSYGGKGYFESLSDRFEETVRSSKDAVTIFCSMNAFYGNPLGNEEADLFRSNALFTFAEDVSEERRGEILTELEKEAGVTDIKSSRDREGIAAKNTVGQYLPIMLCFLSMVIVGVICVAALNMIHNEKTFKTCVICGMSFRRGARILAVYTGMLLVIAAILTLLSWAGLSFLGKIPWYFMNFGASSVVFAVADFLVSGLLIMAASLPILKKYETNGAEK